METHRPVWPRLIAIEGIDGVGTTTLTHNLSDYMQDKHILCKKGCEPTDGEIGKLIRKALSGSVEISMETMALLFAADRREHLYGPGGIASALEEGMLYITDRYLFSSLAYQSGDGQWNWVNTLNSSYPLPGILIYLGMPAKEALERIVGRKEKDIYENVTFQEKVSKAYDYSIKAMEHPRMHMLKLDARDSPDAILQKTLSFIRPLLL